MHRTAVSSVEVTIVVCVVLTLGVWTVLGLYDLGQTGRGLVLTTMGLFALTTAFWSQLRKKKDEDL
jgi:hypothetical protein